MLGQPPGEFEFGQWGCRARVDEEPQRGGLLIVELNPHISRPSVDRYISPRRLQEEERVARWAAPELQGTSVINAAR